MCAIAGFLRTHSGATQPGSDLIRRMVRILHHRGPDEAGAFLDDTCALGLARLSIIDLSTGSQPLCNEDHNLWITYNGELFNYLELRQDLLHLGHKFRTRSDTEVVLHAYEEWGPDCLRRFNGQFAFAIYNRRSHHLFLARDRLGIRPLFYTHQNGRFTFASEIKAIFCDPDISRRIDPKGLDEIFTWWTTAPPRTAFEGICELEAGTYLEVKEGTLTHHRWWEMDFPVEFDRSRSMDSWAEELHALLVDAVRLRLRSDVPVGAYLSGGLDSAATTAMIRHFTDTPVETFSITFDDAAFDESGHQQRMVEHLGTQHHQVRCAHRDIAENFPRVIWHTEKPIIRTAPTPLLILSGLVRQNDFKVVLTGEGADEILGGYDLFKETLIRKFWSRQPESKCRPLLLKKLYPTLPLSAARAQFYLEEFYRVGLSESDAYHFSHMPRISTTVRLKQFLSDDARAAAADHPSMGVFGKHLPPGFGHWHHLPRAQYLEAKSLLSGYLLSSQGDRVSMAHSVEGRYPFLDYRVIELGARIPPWLKIRGLNEKAVLKRAMRDEVPATIRNRVKQPYMAPDSNAFFCDPAPPYLGDLLSEEALAQTNLFKPGAVSKLREKCSRRSQGHLSFRDNMSFVGILSTQILAQQFVLDFRPPTPTPEHELAVWHDVRAGRVSAQNSIRGVKQP